MDQLYSQKYSLSWLRWICIDANNLLGLGHVPLLDLKLFASWKIRKSFGYLWSKSSKVLDLLIDLLFAVISDSWTSPRTLLASWTKIPRFTIVQLANNVNNNKAYMNSYYVIKKHAFIGLLITEPMGFRQTSVRSPWPPWARHWQRGARDGGRGAAEEPAAADLCGCAATGRGPQSET